MRLERCAGDRLEFRIKATGSHGAIVSREDVPQNIFRTRLWWYWGRKWPGRAGLGGPDDC